jgi:hypothetical protein
MDEPRLRFRLKPSSRSRDHVRDVPDDVRGAAIRWTGARRDHDEQVTSDRIRNLSAARSQPSRPGALRTRTASPSG